MNQPAIEFDAARISREVPSCLRECPQWVCWRLIERGGKTTKCPMHSSGQGEASSTNPATWGTFDQAIAACNERRELAGIQSVFRRAEDLDAFALIIVDKDHMIPPDGDGMYQKFIADARRVSPGDRPPRLDSDDDLPEYIPPEREEVPF